ncbi:unnamed protein product [Lupinus luteus]|uniref:Transmembrane protein n=1 Tax=Lupinus luteus TaxID=3873 RepID=A0AAV1Y4X1_LUPLU
MEFVKTRPKNNRNKGCLFHCFRPHDIDYDPFENANTRDQPRVRKKTSYGFLKQALKTTLIETSWGKKIIDLRRRKRNKENLFRSNTSNLEGEKSDKIPNTDHKTTHQTNSNTSSSQCSLAFTPTSLTSSTTTITSSPGTQACSSSSELYQPRQVLINGTELKKQKQKQDEGCYSSKMVVCLPLISLVALILWGKFCAIICTLIGFFLVPPHRRRNGALCGYTEFDSVQYKKKIIMEGLHQRKRHSHIARFRELK